MRRVPILVLGLISVLLMGATVVSYSKYRKSVENFAEMKAESESTQMRYGAAINEIAVIQDSLNAIVLGEEAVQAIPARGQREVEAPGTVHDQVLERIATLKGAIERTKERIQVLDSRLKRNGVKIAGMEKMIDGLKKSVIEKEEQIAQLSSQVDTLQGQVSGLSTEVETKQQEITQRQVELATVYYTMGIEEGAHQGWRHRVGGRRPRSREDAEALGPIRRGGVHRSGYGSGNRHPHPVREGPGLERAAGVELRA